MQYTLEEKYELIKNKLLTVKEQNPIKLINDLMSHNYVDIHGPEHHFLDGAVLLTVIKNCGLSIDLAKCLDLLEKQTLKMPGGMCGFWGMCGSVASISVAFSILDETNPLSDNEDYKNHMKLTSKIISMMSDIGGPRCCKRNAFISLSEARKYASIKYNLNIPTNDIKCEFSNFNKQCIKKRCPFYKK